MTIKMGDLVIQKDEDYNLLFRVTEFDGEYVVLKGTRIPIMTITTVDNLIKLNKKRGKGNQALRRVK